MYPSTHLHPVYEKKHELRKKPQQKSMDGKWIEHDVPGNFCGVSSFGGFHFSVSEVFV